MAVDAVSVHHQNGTEIVWTNNIVGVNGLVLPTYSFFRHANVLEFYSIVSSSEGDEIRNLVLIDFMFRFAPRNFTIWRKKMHF